MTGLNVGNYQPDHSGYGQQLQEQINHNNAAKQLEKQRQKDFDQQQIEKRLQSAPLVNHKSVDNLNKLRYRQELDHQVKAARNSQQPKGDQGVSLQFEQDRVFEKDAYRRALDQQVQDKQRKKEETLNHSRQQDEEFLRKVSSAASPNHKTEELLTRNNYKQQLDLQTELNNARKQELELKEKIEIMNSTGLPLGQYNPNHKDYLNRELTKQISDKEKLKQQQLAIKQAQDAEYLDKLRSHELAIQPDLAYSSTPKLTYKQELDLQTASLQTLKTAHQQRELQEERCMTGLPLGKYHPDHRDELRQGLQQQIEDKKLRLSQQEQDRLSKEKQYLQQINAIKPADPQQLHREVEQAYRSELDQQAQAHRALSKERAQRNLDEERAVTGLPLGKYHPDHREELKRALDSQVQEKRDRLEHLHRIKREQESEHLRLLASVHTADPAQINRDLQDAYKSQLDEQNKSLEEIRRLQSEVERLETINNTGLKIGDYKPYDRLALKRELQDQMDHKRSTRDSERRLQKSLDRQHLQQIERLIEHQREAGQLTSEELNQHKADLTEQIRSNSALRTSYRERDMQEARNSTGLPLGLYNPDHRAELKAALDSQLQEKRARLEREHSQNKELDRSILEGIARAVEAGRSSVTTDRFGREHLTDLETQAAEERRRKQEERDFRRLGDSGLGIGDYKGYDKQELIRVLQSQIEERQKLRSDSKVSSGHTASEETRRDRTPQQASSGPAERNRPR